MVKKADAAAFGLAMIAALQLATLGPAGAFYLAPPPAGGLAVPAFAGIDPCYKKCILNKAWGEQRKFMCQRVCNANPKKQCEDKCWLNHGNSAPDRKKCLNRC